MERGIANPQVPDSRDAHRPLRVPSGVVGRFLYRYGAFVFFAVVMVVWHCLMNTDWGDSEWFAARVVDAGGDPFAMLPAYLADRFATVNSRFVNSALEILFSFWPSALWRLVDTLFWLLIWVELRRLLALHREPAETWLLTAGLLSLPWPYLYSAGWIATGINYTWTTGALLYVLVTLVDGLRGRPLSGLRFGLTLPAAVLAVGQEQTALILFVSTIAVVVCKVTGARARWGGGNRGAAAPERASIGAHVQSPATRQSDRLSASLAALVLGISLAGLLIALFGPGNAMRVVNETETWMPSYPYKSFLSKLDTGFVIVANSLFGQFNPIPCALLVIIGWLCVRRTDANGPFVVIACLAPLFAYLGYTVIAPSFYALPPIFDPLVDFEGRGLEVVGYLFPGTFEAVPQVYGPGDAARTVLALCVVALVLFSCWRAFERPWHRVVAIFALVLGFGASMAVGLSPTAYVSFVRTMLVGWYALVIVTLLAYRALPKSLGLARGTVCGAILTSALMVVAYTGIL